MQFSFTGRESELQHIDHLIKAKQGAYYAVSGRSGIGKSSLLRQLSSIHAKKGQAFIDLNDVPPVQTAVEFFQYFAKCAQGLTHTEKALAKINGTYKTAAELIAPYQPLLQQSSQLAFDDFSEDLTADEKGKFTALVKFLWQLGGVLSKRWQEKSKAALGDPELLLLKALQRDCKTQPLIFIDTYERLQAVQELNRQKITSLYSQPQQRLTPVNKSLSLQDWLDRLLEFLQQNGAIIVIAGRKTGPWRSEDLQRFNDEDIANIVGSSDYADLQALLIEQHSRCALLSLLKRLSFDGIPLWLQLALNFVSLELANGVDLTVLAAKPDIHALFATPETESDLNSDNIDHANCKLALFKRVMQHNLELENEAWKMALPRRLSQPVLALIFADQADAMREAFTKAGLMPTVRWMPETHVALHEEIRDLLLAYSRYQGWQETEATKAIHQQLAELFERRYQATREISYLLERLYHSLMSETNVDLESIKEPGVLFDMALKLQAEKQYVQMTQVMLRLIAVQADYESAWFGLGVALSELGRLDEAMAAYLQQLEIKPDHEYAGYNLGNALSELGQLDEAVAAYRQQLKIKSGHEQAWNNLGVALHDLGRLDEAVAAYRQQLEVKQDHENAGYNLGNALRELGRLDEAVAAYRQHLEVKPGHEYVGNNLGNVLSTLGRLDEAVAAYRQHLDVKPDHEHAGNNLGNALRKLGRLDEAVAAYRQQLEVKSDHEHAGNGLGMTYWQQDHLELAQQAFADALEFNPQYLSALSNDAELALVQNDKTRCLQRIARASALIDNKTEEYVILPFLGWLAEPENAPDAVYHALEQLDKSVKITWSFDEIEPVILRLTTEQQTIARQFIAGFQSNPS